MFSSPRVHATSWGKKQRLMSTQTGGGSQCMTRGLMRAVVGHEICQLWISYKIWDLPGVLQNTKTPLTRKYEKITKKNYKIPHSGVGPENTKKRPKNYENGLKMAIFVIFLYIFCIFGPPRNGGFCNFLSHSFRISGLEGFSYSVAPQGDLNTRCSLRRNGSQRVARQAALHEWFFSPPNSRKRAEYGFGESGHNKASRSDFLN